LRSALLWRKNMIKFRRGPPSAPSEPSMTTATPSCTASRDCWPRKPEFGGALAAT